MKFWKRKKKIIRIPINPGGEDTEIRFTYDGVDVSVMRLVSIHRGFNQPSTAEFADLSYFERYKI